MQQLKELQAQFQALLLGEQPPLTLDFISSAHATERFAIYRQTVFENLRHTLEITFPAIWILLGKECADSVAYTFIKQSNNLPTSGCLDDWGANFANVFDTITELKHLPYLKEVAFCEWFKHQSYCATDTVPLDVTALQQFTEEQLTSLRFHFNPSMFLWQSPFPLQKIFAVIEHDDAPSVNLDEGSAYAIIFRLDYRVELYWLDEPAWYFLNVLKQDECFNQAYEQTLLFDENFDITSMICFMFEHQLVVGIA